MKNIYLLIWCLCIVSIQTACAQTETVLENQLPNAETAITSADLPPKIAHAEPLYIDLIRDLGARKGEHEWNVGLGLTDQDAYDSYEALIEYEWAPMDRFGLEVELPFSFYSGSNAPATSLQSIKVAMQWTFLVHTKARTSMALGYINEFTLSDFKEFGNPLITGNVFNPFLVVAKRLGTNFHSLVYTGPMVHYGYDSAHWQTSYDVNTSFHYMIPGTQNFVGVELNKVWEEADFDMTIRPQMRVGIAEGIKIGIVTGIPISKKEERLSTFLRLIWEPHP